MFIGKSCKTMFALAMFLRSHACYNMFLIFISLPCSYIRSIIFIKSMSKLASFVISLEFIIFDRCIQSHGRKFICSYLFNSWLKFQISILIHVLWWMTGLNARIVWNDVSISCHSLENHFTGLRWVFNILSPCNLVYQLRSMVLRITKWHCRTKLNEIKGTVLNLILNKIRN